MTYENFNLVKDNYGTKSKLSRWIPGYGEEPGQKSLSPTIKEDDKSLKNSVVMDKFIDR